jgi:hypothetical protein
MFRTDRPNTDGNENDAKTQSGQIILNAVTTGTLPEADKAYLAQMVSARTGATSEEATKRVDQVTAVTQSAAANAQQGVDIARKAGATTTIFTALAMQIGAFIACAAAALGGQKRDEHA